MTFFLKGKESKEEGQSFSIRKGVLRSGSELKC